VPLVRARRFPLSVFARAFRYSLTPTSPRPSISAAYSTPDVPTIKLEDTLSRCRLSWKPLTLNSRLIDERRGGDLSCTSDVFLPRGRNDTLKAICLFAFFMGGTRTFRSGPSTGMRMDVLRHFWPVIIFRKACRLRGIEALKA
jgi:hypothetical protein